MIPAAVPLAVHVVVKDAVAEMVGQAHAVLVTSRMSVATKTLSCANYRQCEIDA